MWRSRKMIGSRWLRGKGASIHFEPGLDHDHSWEECKPIPLRLMSLPAKQGYMTSQVNLMKVALFRFGCYPRWLLQFWEYVSCCSSPLEIFQRRQALLRPLHSTR